MKIRFLCMAWLCLHATIGAQDDPPTPEPTPETGNEVHSVARPVRLYGHIRLDGLWEIHIGGQNTGVEVSIRQISDRYHATFSKPPKNNPLGIKVGDEFLWATVKDYGGHGTLFVVKEPEEEGGPVQREQAPVRFKINDSAERLRVQVDKEDMDDAMKKFELVRVGRIETIRLYSNGPGGLRPSGTILEDQPMIVEIKHSNPRPSPIDVTLTSGDQSLTLTAHPLDDDPDEGPRLGLLRTEAFYPTFAMQLGVERPEKEPQEPAGREASEDDWQSFTGSWRTLYQDEVLGPVAGWIHIDSYGRAELRYRQPSNDAWKPMKLKSARVEGTTEPVEATENQPAVPAYPKMVLQFEGQGVTSEKVEKDIPDEDRRLLLDADQAAPIQIAAKDFETQVDLTHQDLPDLRRVNLTLERGMDNGSLLWNWHYRGDRSTGRDREGLGRAGTLRRTEGDEESTVADVVGNEVWMRTPPTILAAYATKNQTAVDKSFWDQPVYENRYKPQVMTSRGLDPHTFGKHSIGLREIFIVARNLPPATKPHPHPDLVIGDGSGVKEYRIRARGAEGAADNSDALKKAWHQYRESQLRSAPADTGSDASQADAPPDATMKALQEGMTEEGLIVLAILGDQAEPGPQAFTLAEADGSWNLKFGDLRGELKLARQLAESVAAAGDDPGSDGEWEALNPAFIPEKIHLVVELQQFAESITEIKAVLGHNDEIITADHTAAPGDDPQPFLLTPDPNDPKTYRSPAIHLVQKGSEETRSLGPGEIVLEVRSGDKLTARIQSDSGYHIQPTRVTAEVMGTPAELNQLWKQAVKTAADLAGQPVEDWDDVARGTADSATNFIFTEFAWNATINTVGGGLYGHLLDVANYAKRNGVTVPYHNWLPQREPSGGLRSVKISIGDHAAMLLLRDEFLKMMEEQIADWQRNQSPAKIRALYENQKTAIANKQSPLSFMRIPIRSLPVYREEPRANAISNTRVYLAENKLWWVAVENTSPGLAAAIKFFGGDDVGREDDPLLYQIFDDAFLGYKTRVPAEAEYFELFQWSAFNHAYKQWGPHMRQSMAQAAAIPDGDVAGLLKLTGMSFEAVAKRVLPRMMKLETDAELRQSKWVPDRLARAHIKGVSVVGAAVRAQEEYSAIDTTAMMAVASVATIPLGGGGFWSALIAAGVSAADVAYTVYTDVYGNQKRKEELEFEVGAGAVLGAGRAAAKESKILSDFAQTFAIAGSALGMGVDGAALVRSVKAMKTAKLIERTNELMRQVDFADPTQLRKLKPADRAAVRELLERSEKLAEQGRFGEISPEGFKMLKNEQSILKGLSSADGTSDDVIELANQRRQRLIQAGDKQPKTQWRDQDFVKADENLKKKIESNQKKMDELKSEKDAITKKYKDAEEPPPHTDDARRVRELDRASVKIKNETDAFKQRRDLITNYRKPQVKIPRRQAEILRGEGPPPSRREFEALRETRSRVAQKRPPVSDEGLEAVDLDAAKTRIDDLTRKTQDEIDSLMRTPETEIARRVDAGELDPRALEKARAKLDDLKEIRTDIDDLSQNVRSDRVVELADSDADLLAGKRSGLLKYDEAKVIDAIIQADGDWSQLSKLANGSPDDQLLMQKVAQWRQKKMDSALNQSMREAEDILGYERGSIQASAFGSTNLTSDYDISVKAPNVGGSRRGSELAVRRFQEKVRTLFGGRESGMVLDVNVYTDPVHTIFKGTDLEGAFAGLSAGQLDRSRQFLFQQMANVRYRTPAQWQAMRKRVLDGVPPQTREAFADILDQAEGAHLIASERVANRLKDFDLSDARRVIEDNDSALTALNESQDQALKALAERAGKSVDEIRHTDEAKALIDDFSKRAQDLEDGITSAQFKIDNATLQANNVLYSDALEFIDGSKTMIGDLDDAIRGNLPAGQVTLPKYFQNTEMSKLLGEAENLIKSGDPNLISQGKQILEEIRNKAVLNLRNKQGEALFYAAEAYQTEATINHVVKEIQAAGKKITVESIMSGKHNLPPGKAPLSTDDYINSYYENGANLVKELNAKHILDDLGRPDRSSKYLDKGATKASKYFKRQLDAASMAKLDMEAVKVPGFPDDFTMRDLVESTLDLESNRGNMSAFKETLKKYNMTGEDYLNRVILAQEELDRQLIAKSELTGYVNQLRNAEKAVESEAAKAILTGTRRKKDWVRGYGIQHYHGGDEAEDIRNEFDQSTGERLAELDLAEASGRFLTADQQQQHARLKKQAADQQAFDLAIIGARLSGVPTPDIDAALKPIDRRADDWRPAAAEKIRQITRQKLAADTPAPRPSAKLSDAIQSRLKLDTGADDIEADQLIQAIHDSGQHTQSLPSINLDVLAANQQAGKTVLAKIHQPNGNASWIQVHEIMSDQVIADDPISHRPIAYPHQVFTALAADPIIADPFRQPDGSLTP